MLPDHWIIPEETIWEIMRQAYARHVVELIKGSGARSVLEIGCSDGRNWGQFVEAGLEKIVGVDWSRNGIDHARRMVPKAEFYCGDTRDEDFMRKFSKLFGALAMVEVIEHIPPEDCVAVLQNLLPLLEPGGRFVLTTPSVTMPKTNPQYYGHFTPELLSELIAETGGLEILSIEGYGDVPAEKSHYRLARLLDNCY